VAAEAAAAPEAAATVAVLVVTATTAAPVAIAAAMAAMVAAVTAVMAALFTRPTRAHGTWISRCSDICAQRPAVGLWCNGLENVTFFSFALGTMRFDHHTHITRGCSSCYPFFVFSLSLSRVACSVLLRYSADVRFTYIGR